MNVHVVKTVPIGFKQVVGACQKVRHGGKAAGIEGESWNGFDKKLQNNLYVIWNRLAPGSYYPSSVRGTEIPKNDGSIRKLGIPTLRGRIAQEVARKYMEQRIEPIFHDSSYGYRPLRSARQAIGEVKKNCKTTDWAIDLDISKFFDEISHELMLKAVEHVIEEKWASMCVKRWLEMKIVNKQGEENDRGGRGAPQGGAISPLLANLYLHFSLDKWLEQNYGQVKFVRYAGDMALHCQNKQEAEALPEAIRQRSATVGLRLNEKKTQIVYCRDYRRTAAYSKVQFGFLGFSFRPRKSQSKHKKHASYMAFTAEISKADQQKITEAVKTGANWRNTQQEMVEIAEKLNSRLRGWMNYFGLYGKRELRRTMLRLERRLLKWTMKKYKITSIREAVRKLSRIRKEYPRMFYHWQAGHC